MTTGGSRPSPEAPRQARRSSAGAPQVDVGSSLVLPGLVDLHNHLAYNTLPLWTEPTQHDAVHASRLVARAPRRYAASTTWPAYALITACPEELLAYVETKAIVGGTTTIQGSPPQNRPRDGWLVRNVEDESFGSGRPDLVYASTLTAKPRRRSPTAPTGMRHGSTFVYHCAEGQRGAWSPGSATDAARRRLPAATFVAVHANAVDPAEFAAWTAAGGVVWSPFSNLWLYGADHRRARRPRRRRARSASARTGRRRARKHVLGELKVARLVADHLGWDLTDADLVRDGAPATRVTCWPGPGHGRSAACSPARSRTCVVLHASRAASSRSTRSWSARPRPTSSSS